MVNIDHDYSWAIALFRLNYYHEGFNPTLSGLRDVRILPGGHFKDTL